MGLFDGKSAEDKNLEKIARALDEMRLKDADGRVHAGCFCTSLLADASDASLILDGVLEFLQRNDREIVNVATTATSAGSNMFTVLYR